MHILDGLKEKFKDVKLSLLKYLTPLEYMEFTIKMLMVFDKAKVDFCLWLSTVILVVVLILNSFFPIAIKSGNILIAIVLSVILNILFIKFRSGKNRNSNIDYEVKQVNIKDQDINVSVNIPATLKKYMKLEEKNFNDE